MQADIENKHADTGYKRKLTDWEPWKAMALAFGAGAALFTALAGILGGIIGWLLHSGAH